MHLLLVIMHITLVAFRLYHFSYAIDVVLNIIQDVGTASSKPFHLFDVAHK